MGWLLLAPSPFPLTPTSSPCNMYHMQAGYVCNRSVMQAGYVCNRSVMQAGYVCNMSVMQAEKS